MISNINSFNSYYNSSSQSQIGASVLKKIKDDPKIWSRRRDPKSPLDNSLVKYLEKNKENRQKQELINTIKQFSNKENIHKSTGKWIEVCGSPW